MQNRRGKGGRLAKSAKIRQIWGEISFVVSLKTARLPWTEIVPNTYLYSYAFLTFPLPLLRPPFFPKPGTEMEGKHKKAEGRRKREEISLAPEGGKSGGHKKIRHELY